MLLRELIALHDDDGPAGVLPDCVGDAYLYEHNPVYRRIRDAALASGYRFTSEQARDYFAFPLVSLQTILAEKRIPYRANLAGLTQLEDSRPCFFELADLKLNRPAPNYLLHESAHAVAFDALFGRPASVTDALADRDRLVSVILGEAYAMTTEYFAACCVSGPLHDWFFSINSYRHRIPGKKAIGELVSEYGLKPIAWTVLAAFLYDNFLVEKMSMRRLNSILAFSPLTSDIELSREQRNKLRWALANIMVMNREFVQDTSKIFLTMLGYPREIKRILRPDPLELAAKDAAAQAGIEKILSTLSDDPRDGE